MKGVDTVARIRREFFVRAERSRRSSGSCMSRATRFARCCARTRRRSTTSARCSRCPSSGRGSPSLIASCRQRSPSCPRAPDADPDLRRAARARLRGRLRCGAPLCSRLAARAGLGDGVGLRAAELRPGEAYQFDWSHEVVLINGTTVQVKVAHVRLCHSRMMFVRAYPRESQEMVFDATTGRSPSSAAPARGPSTTT